MSSLSAQLAAIHNDKNETGNNTSLVGQSFAPSKSHDDAVGRGIRHSTEIGYSLALQQGKFVKPSILHDKDSAEDIPLTTLRENCVAALQQLQSIDNFYASPHIMSTLCGPHSVSYERGLQTSSANVKTDGQLRELLTHLATVLGDDEKWKIPALHVLEYILRRYDIHIHLASHLVLCTLPQHESPIFARVLQLVDLTAMPSYWLFLRPYSAPGVSPIPRSTIAKWTGNDNHEELIVQLCQLAQEASCVYVDGQNIRRGISLIVSFVAAVLTEAIILLSKRLVNIKESTVRCLLPHILDAVEGKYTSCADWISFGYVMASTLLENCVLMNDVKEVLATSILKGVTSSRSSNDDFTSIEKIENAANAVVAVYSIVVKIEKNDEASNSKNLKTKKSFLPSVGKNNSQDLGCNIPITTYRAMVKLQDLLPPSLGFLYDERDLDVKPLLGALLSLSIPRLLGTNKRTSNKEAKSITKKRKATMDLILKLVCLIPLRFPLMYPTVCESILSNNYILFSVLSILNIAIISKNQLKEPSLHALWSDRDDHSLPASTAALLVTSFCENKNNGVSDEKNTTSIDCFQTLLDTIRSLNPAGCDAGIAHAISSLTSRKSPNGKSETKEIALKLAQLLRGESDMKKMTSQNGSNKNNINGTRHSKGLINGHKNHHNDDVMEIDYILPPRVALEHPDSHIRIRAIDTLVKEANSKLDKTNELQSTEDDLDVNDEIAEALVRRFSSDDNASVATAAADAVSRLSAENNLSDIFFLKPSIADDILAGLKKWSINSKMSKSSRGGSIISKKDKKKKSKRNINDTTSINEYKIEAMNASLKLCSLALQNMSRQRLDNYDVSSSGESSSSTSLDKFDSLMIGLVSQFGINELTGDSNDAKLALDGNIIDKSILEALMVSTDKSNDNDVLNLLAASPSCLRIVKKIINSESNLVHKEKITNCMRKMFLLNILKSFDKQLQNMESEVNVQVATSLALLFLRKFSSELHDNIISGCLGKSIKHLIRQKKSELVVKILIDIAELEIEKKSNTPSNELIQIILNEIDSSSGIPGTSVVLLLEASCRQDVSSSSISLFLSLAGSLLALIEDIKDNIPLLRYTLIMVLALLSHNDFHVRDRSLKLLKQMKKIGNDNLEECKAINEICALANSSSEMSSILRGDGMNSLPKFLRQVALSSKNPTLIRKILLQGCAGDTSAVQYLSRKKGNLFGTGTSYSASVLLNAMESAGEDAFSLHDRWEYSGRPILSSVMEADGTVQLPEPAKLLIETVVVMLKGIKIDNEDIARSTNMIITTGPSRRSYSIGAASDGISTIDPYPDTMQNFICESLSIALEKKKVTGMRTLLQALCTLVLQTTTWSQIIFPKIMADLRKQITMSLLSLKSIHSNEFAGIALQNLPLSVSDFIFLLESEQSAASSSATTSMLAVSFIAECIQARSGVLTSDKKIMDLSSTLFEWLSLLSKKHCSRSIDSTEGSEYTCASLIYTLLALHENIKVMPNNHDKAPTPRRKGRRRSKSNEDNANSSSDIHKLADHAHIIVTLVGGKNDNHSNDTKPSLSGTAKTAALALLTHLCALAPTAIVGSLLPALMNVISSANTQEFTTPDMKDDNLTSNVGDALMAVIPAYCTHAKKAGMTITDLIRSFIVRCDADDEFSWLSRLNLFKYLVDALLVVPNENDLGNSVASAICLTTANEAFRTSKGSLSTNQTEMEIEENPIEFAFQLSLRTSATNQVTAAVKILRMVNDFLSTLISQNDKISLETATDVEQYNMCSEDIILMALEGPTRTKVSKSELTLTEKGQSSMGWFVIKCLSIIDRVLNSRPVRKLIKDDDNTQADSCLTIWQDLMQLQISCAEARSKYTETDNGYRKKIRLLDECSKGAGECLTTLQRVLPAPHFLACISSLINDEDDDSMMQAKSISLLSERASLTDPTSAEAELFIEAVPDLIRLISRNSDIRDSNNVLQQTSLIAVEQIARSLGVASSNSKIKKMVFMPALKVITDTLNDSAKSLMASDLNEHETNPDPQISSSIHVLSTAALCASTLVHLLKAKCLSHLPKLARPLMDSLSKVNSRANSTMKDSGMNQSSKLLQLAILRTMVSVAETLPQFLLPYLDRILSPNALPSIMLRQDVDDDSAAVKMMAERFDRALSDRTPCRQLIPALNKAMAKCLNEGVVGPKKWREGLSILSILKGSIKNASRSDLGPVISKVLNTLIQVYGFDENNDARSQLINSANDVLLSLVLKLSEAQLRPMYAKLRDWRGEIKHLEESDEATALRRNAFWSLSAALSKQLKSIFLPCVGTVVPDMISELVCILVF